MRVVVTGATSMIGAALTEVCVRNGCEVLAVVRENTKRLDRLPASDLIRVEYADLDHLSALRGDGKPYDVFYHFAWGHTARAERNDPAAQEDNIRTALEAVEAARRLGCHRFIGAGSQAEYGRVDGVIREDTPARPATAYGIAKLAAGLLCGNRCGQLGMEHLWVRIFSVYGPNDTDASMISTAVDDFLRGRTAHFSSGAQSWNFLYESDAGEMFYRFGEKALPSGTYLAAHPESRVLKDYILDMMRVYGPEARGEFAPAENPPLLGLRADMSRTLEKLEYAPRVSFEEGIAAVIRRRKQLQTEKAAAGDGESV